MSKLEDASAAAPRTEAAVPDARPAQGLRARVLTGGSATRTARIADGGLVVGSDGGCGLVIEDDKRVSRRHLELMPHPAGALARDLGSMNGVVLSGAKISEAVIPQGTVLKLGSTELIVETEVGGAELPISSRSALGSLIGKSLPMRGLYTVLERAAPTDYTILLEGETGTGKEVFARTVHELSKRRAGPFIVFDCASTAESLLESELFGHVRGAFTGAVEAREGAFRAANGGTLFIDELSSLPLALQAKLLRALEGRRVRPVGADKDVAVDIRVVAATNRALREEVRAGRFREDLYYRLCVVRIPIPPLRDRREDIPLLVEHFLRAAGNTSTPAGARLASLVAHDWPGNVRELRNTIERALALAGRPDVPFDALPLSVGDATPLFAWPVEDDLPFKDAKDALVAAFERRYVTQLLAGTRGNITEAARRAGLSRRHLFDVMRKHGLVADKEATDPGGVDEDPA